VVKNVASVIDETRTILTIPPQGTLQHVAAFRLGQLPDNSALTVIPALTLPSSRMEEARRYLRSIGHDFSRPLISVHPGSGGARKCWPLDRYCALLDRLIRWQDPFILLFSGPAEEESIADALQAYVGSHTGRAAHLRNAGLAVVSALLSMSDLYIGNDSGISHLAAGMGTRSITIFGPTDPILWKPLGNRGRVVQSKVVCAPCGDDNSRGCRERICLSAVSVESTYDAAMSQLTDACP
jgi:ADP-heptose:LPS heptosyltransferase